MEKENIKVEKQKKSSKNIIAKIIVILIIALLIILSAVIYNKVSSKNRRAQQIFGDDYCEAILHMSTMDLVKHKCEICGVEFEDSSMHANICSECAEETQRCEFCGKKITDEIKEQRRNRLHGNNDVEN